MTKKLTFKLNGAVGGVRCREFAVRSLPAVKVTIQTDAPLVWRLERTLRGVLVTCDLIEVTLEADDETEARSLVIEGMHLFFLDHVESGTFHDLMATLGWQAELPEGLPVLEFDVPWQLST